MRSRHDEQMNGRLGGELIRIGDLASSAGLTVRALHHYEDVGLLTPAQRSEAGHRLYGPEAVERLYRVSLLRRLGLSLDQIARALDGPDWSLVQSLRSHADNLADEVAKLHHLQSVVTSALADAAENRDPTNDLLEVLSTMVQTETLLRRRISILVYRDVKAAHDYLVDVFGLTPGDVTLGPDGDAVHAELYAGDGVVWLHPETDEFGLASPRTVGSATAMMAVMVDDVDEHHRLVDSKGAEIVYPPVDQPYRYREYSARDLEGGLWSFMKPLDD